MKNRLLVQIDPDSKSGKEILPSNGDIQWLSSHDRAIYEVLKIGEYGHYEEFKDIASGEMYESSLSPGRFRTVYKSGGNEAFINKNPIPIPEEEKEDETIII